MSATPSLAAWPDPLAVPLFNKGRARYYKTPEGEFPSVTTALKVLGLGQEGLIAWSAREERKACLAAAADVFAEDEHDGSPADFLARVENRIGVARQHQRQIAKAADIGTAIHQAINSYLRKQLGLPVPLFQGELEDAALVGFMSFEDWWKASGYTAIRTEQPVWSKELRAAGTADLIVSCPKRGLGLVDFKSSKGVYESMHVQVAAYADMARRWSDINWCEIVRFPKSLDDPQFEVVPLGKLYGGKTASEPQLLDAFKACVTLWETFSA